MLVFFSLSLYTMPIIMCMFPYCFGSDIDNHFYVGNNVTLAIKCTKKLTNTSAHQFSIIILG